MIKKFVTKHPKGAFFSYKNFDASVKTPNVVRLRDDQLLWFAEA